MSILKVMLDLPKSFYLNFKVFPFRIACKLPLRVDYRMQLGVLDRGTIELPPQVSRFMVS